MGVDVTFGDAIAGDALARGSEAPMAMPEPAISFERDARKPTARRVDAAARCRSIDELRASLESFEGCGLKRTANRLCFGDGNSKASIMLIGEAPGSQEDRVGRPFVGASGQLLDRMLASIGLDRDLVWITNLIFWRPPGNRTPTADEIASCQPFLERQIELIAPKIVLFVGGTAAKALLGVKEGVTKLRGRQSDYHYGDGLQARCLVTFHPAFLLRQPLQKKFAWRDMLTFAEMADARGLRRAGAAA